jgi:hypothetical protein
LAADLLAWRGGAESFLPQNGGRRCRQEADTGLAFLVLIWFALLVFLFGPGGLVVLGAALLFLLVPNHRVDGC